MERDQIVEAEKYRQNVKWMRALMDVGVQALSTWLSTFRNGIPCQYDTMLYHGSFNLGISFRFEDGIKWLLRFPKQGYCIHADEKMEREVAMMHYINRSTSIPVPEVHAWGLSADNIFNLGPYIIMDFIDGVTLASLWTPDADSGPFVGMLRDEIPEEDLRKVYRQMCRFSLELADRRFDSIGSLASHDGRLVAPFTMKMHETESHSRTAMQGISNGLSSFASTTGTDM